MEQAVKQNLLRIHINFLLCQISLALLRVNCTHLNHTNNYSLYVYIPNLGIFKIHKT